MEKLGVQVGEHGLEIGDFRRAAGDAEELAAHCDAEGRARSLQHLTERLLMEGDIWWSAVG